MGDQPDHVGYFVGRFVRLLSIPSDGYRYSPDEETLRQSAIGRICQIVEPYKGTAKDGLRTASSQFLLHYACLSADGVSGYGLYAGPEDVEPLDATEDMLLLYSKDVWQLLRPFGELQDTPTFARLAEVFGLAIR